MLEHTSITITNTHNFLFIVIFITNESRASPTVYQVDVFWGQRMTAIKPITAIKQVKELTDYQLNRDF